MAIKGYLEKHGNQFRVQVWVPLHLQPVYGKKTIKVPLRTDSRATANLLKVEVLNRLQREFREASKKVPSPVDALTEEAMRWREAIHNEEPPTVSFVDEKTGEVVEYDNPIVSGLAIDRAEEIKREKGTQAAATFFKIAIGEATPIAPLIPLWIAEAGIKPRQQRDYKRAVEKFAAWATAPIEEITRKKAGQYISEAFIAPKVNVKTANKDISCLSTFWKWLVKRGYVEVNVWEKQSISKKLAQKSGKRAYTDEELKKLLTGTNDSYLLDLIRIAALSGMRREEIMLLRKADCVDGVFNVRDAKTLAGIRKPPIHSALKETITHRLTGKADDDWLFHEVGSEGGGVVERGDYAGKKFNAYRKKLGLDERPEGQRQSNIEFHSLRRWFIRSARNALQNGAKGYDPWTIAEVAGHDNKSPDKELQMTMGVYAGPQTKEAKRACVEAVKLPS